MYTPILICGPSGSGKSTSLRNLPPDKTAIVNIERKLLPFPSAKDFKNQDFCNSTQEVSISLNKWATNKDIEIIVIESFTSYDEMILKMNRELYKGYDIYTNHNKAIRNWVEQIKMIGLQKFLVLTGIDEVIGIDTAEGGKISKRTLKVEGRELTGTIEKEFSIVLFTDVRKDPKSGNMLYQFQSNTDGITTAKTPMGLYNGSQYIENDLNSVIKKIKEYYK
jgi:hypothetical protein